MSVLHVGLAQGRGVSTARVVRPLVLVDEAALAAARRLAQSPALGHLCAVSDRWSRQNVPKQDSQRNGRKSSWLQYGSWQWEPMRVGSDVSIVE